MSELLECRQAAWLGPSGSSPSRTAASPVPDPPARRSGAARGRLLGLQVRMDPALKGPPQFLEEAFHRVRLEGMGGWHHPVRGQGLHLPARVAAAPSRSQPSMAGSCAQAPRMRAISSPFMFFCQAHHSRPVIGSMATATGCTCVRTARPGRPPPRAGPHPAHLADQPHPHLVAPHDPRPRLQPDRLQPGPEPPFFQAVWAWGSAFVWRGRGAFSRIPSRGSSVYRLPTR